MFGMDKDETTGNEKVDKNLTDAEAEAKAAEELAAKKQAEAAELAAAEQAARKTGRKYARVIVRHAIQDGAGLIYAANEQSYYITPDVEVVLPMGIVQRLKEAYVPYFDKTGEQKGTRPMYSVETVKADLTQYDYKKFLAECAKLIKK